MLYLIIISIFATTTIISLFLFQNKFKSSTPIVVSFSCYACAALISVALQDDGFNVLSQSLFLLGHSIFYTYLWNLFYKDCESSVNGVYLRFCIGLFILFLCLIYFKLMEIITSIIILSILFTVGILNLSRRFQYFFLWALAFVSILLIECLKLFYLFVFKINAEIFFVINSILVTFVIIGSGGIAINYYFSEEKKGKST